MNHRWIKSHKAVQFPCNNLDLTDFLAAIPSETLIRHRHLLSETIVNGNAASDSANEDSDSYDSALKLPSERAPSINQPGNELTRKRLESTSLMTHPVQDEDLIDFHQHRVLPGYNKLDITYSLYAAVVLTKLFAVYLKNPFNCFFSIVPFRNHGGRTLRIVRQKS